MEWVHPLYYSPSSELDLSCNLYYIGKVAKRLRSEKLWNRSNLITRNWPLELYSKVLSPALKVMYRIVQDTV